MHKWVISPPENTNLTIEKQTTYENQEIHHQETGDLRFTQQTYTKIYSYYIII